MLEDLPLSTWAPVLAVAFVFMAAGAVWAVISLGAGHWRDPEAAKFGLLGRDEHPDEQPSSDGPSPST